MKVLIDLVVDVRSDPSYVPKTEEEGDFEEEEEGGEVDPRISPQIRRREKKWPFTYEEQGHLYNFIAKYLGRRMVTVQDHIKVNRNFLSRLTNRR